jgi:hypothetical protein
LIDESAHVLSLMNAAPVKAWRGGRVNNHSDASAAARANQRAQNGPHTRKDVRPVG